MAKNKYQKTKKQYSEDGINWYDVEPPEYNIGVLLEENSADCGYQEPQYRWYALTDTETYYVCDGYNKYYKEVYQVSDDGGKNWINVYPEQSRRGSLIEENSYDCDYGVTWELMNNVYICEEWTEPVIPAGKSYLEVVFANNHDDSLITVQVDEENILNYVGSHTPIGIKLPVLMPDGYYRVMSLYNMSAANNTGTINNEFINDNLASEEDYPLFSSLMKEMYGAEYKQTDYNDQRYRLFHCPIIAIGGQNSYTYSCNISSVLNFSLNEQLTKSIFIISLPYDIFPPEDNLNNISFIECNKKLRYYSRSSMAYYQAIATFDTDYNFNNECIKNIDIYEVDERNCIIYDNYLTNNPFSYYEGDKNTNILLTHNDKGFFNSAKLCSEYVTKGTTQGQWYLPSLLELSIAGNLIGKVNDTITLLNNNYNNIFSYFNGTRYCHSNISFNSRWPWMIRDSKLLGNMFILNLEPNEYNYRITLNAASSGSDYCARAFTKIK